ncbi:hypothetical protein RRG08_052823 [Elysia crispata]|uniref:Uncharacterized protein n=1 Tax=Elysia crispata TaxID=231223 RepID=A0AAE1B732_9GAST|nr:hypothetical protein RRG08_052823 [Elysia crispata]
MRNHSGIPLKPRSVSSSLTGNRRRDKSDRKQTQRKSDRKEIQRHVGPEADTKTCRTGSRHRDMSDRKQTKTTLTGNRNRDNSVTKVGRIRTCYKSGLEHKVERLWSCD